MNEEQYKKGLEVRRAVMGDSYVDKALNSATDFTQPLQDLVGLSRHPLLNFVSDAIKVRHYLVINGCTQSSIVAPVTF